MKAPCNWSVAALATVPPEKPMRNSRLALGGPV